MNPNNPNKPTESRKSAGALPSDAEKRLENDARDLAKTAQHDFEQAKATAEKEVGKLVEEGKHQLDDAVAKARGLASEQKDLLSDQIGGVAHAVTRVAEELEAEDSATAGYARSIADGVERVSRTIKDRDIDELLHMAEDFGRKQPAAFMAAAAIAGFAASRFLVASANRRQAAGTGQGYGQYAGTGVGDGGASADYTGTARATDAGLAARNEKTRYDAKGGSV